MLRFSNEGIPGKPSAPKATISIASISKSPLKKFIWYFVIVSALCALQGLELFGDYENVNLFYILLQAGTLIIGSFHVWYINEKLGWNEEMVMMKKFIFTWGIVICSMIFFYLLSRFLVLKSDQGYIKVYVLAFLPFMLPLVVVATFDKAMQIEPKKYKLWFYADTVRIPDPDLIDFTNSFILSFEFPRKYNDTIFSNFKFKAPLDMQFSDLFYMYLTEYNDKNREKPIEYQDNSSKSYGWLFYIKPNAWWKSSRIFDPYMTVRQNRIQEHYVIAPKRFVVE